LDIVRKLATVRSINNISPIPDADNIECATVDGWEVVVKKGQFNVGDICIYLEIDSWVPNSVAPFLTKPDKEPKEFEGIKGERLKTARIRGQLSQGLILDYKDFPDVFNAFHKTRIIDSDPMADNNFDATEILGIVKWEKPVPANLRGLIKGNFPSFIRKTDQERVQNMGKSFRFLENRGGTYNWELTEKLDGSSMTAYINNGVFGVCSRNLDLLRDENNAFWRAAIEENMESFLSSKNGNFAIQGELIGEGIQGNPYKLKGTKFYTFDVFDIDNRAYLSSIPRLEFLRGSNIQHVPIIDFNMEVDLNIKNILSYVDGLNSNINNAVYAEGIVYKCIQLPDLSFKAISNSWLLKTGN